MPVDRRQANGRWNVLDEKGRPYFGRYDHAQLAVLMDLRDELQKLNRLLACPNFVAIPRKLGAIRRNTTKPRKRTKKGRQS